jgi:membrane protease YdiL (CAAX protease family)
MSTPESTTASGKWRTFLIKEGRLRPVWRLILYVPVLVLTGIIIVLPITSLLNVVGLPASVFNQAPYSVAGLARRTVSTGLTVSALVVGTWACRRFLDKRDLASLGLGFSRRGLGELVVGVLAGVGFLSIIFLIELFMGWIDIQGWAWQTRPLSEALASLYIAILVTIEVAMKEEIITRGYLLQTLEEWIRLPAAVIVSSILFSLLHFINPSMTGWLYYVVPFTHTLGGILLALLYLSRRSLWIPIGFHFAWNLCEYELFALVGALPQHATFLVTEVTGPSFWVGLPHSAFGPEVGALGVLGEVLIVGLLWWKIRSRGMAA